MTSSVRGAGDEAEQDGVAYSKRAIFMQ